MWVIALWNETISKIDGEFEPQFLALDEIMQRHNIPLSIDNLGLLSPRVPY